MSPHKQARLHIKRGVHFLARTCAVSNSSSSMSPPLAQACVLQWMGLRRGNVPAYGLCGPAASTQCSELVLPVSTDDASRGG